MYSAHRHRSCGVDADLESQRERLGSADPILRLCLFLISFLQMNYEVTDFDATQPQEHTAVKDTLNALLSTKYVRIFPSCTYANDPNTAHLGQAASQATHLVCRQRYCGCLRENVSSY